MGEVGKNELGRVLLDQLTDGQLEFVPIGEPLMGNISVGAFNEISR